jgi:hypothetical protein
MPCWIHKHNVGDRVHHWETGRMGTVVETWDGWKMIIKFDEWGSFAWAGMPDGLRETRKKTSFLPGDAPVNFEAK